MNIELINSMDEYFKKIDREVEELSLLANPHYQTLRSTLEEDNTLGVRKQQEVMESISIVRDTIVEAKAKLQEAQISMNDLKQSKAILSDSEMDEDFGL